MRKFFFMGCIFSSIGLVGCDLPKSGPGINSMSVKKQLDNHGKPYTLVMHEVNLQEALDLSENMKMQENALIQSSISKINFNTSDKKDPALHSGDDVSISILSFSSAPDGSGSKPLVTKLGTFSVLHDGQINLPYIQNVRVAGLNYAQLQKKISQLYLQKGILNNSSVIVQNPPPSGGKNGDSVLVIGQVSQSKEVRWLSGGMTLAHVLAESMGSTSAADVSSGESSNDTKSTTKFATNVTVIRNGSPIGTLPIKVALQNDIFLAPHDKVIVKREAPINITVLGGGASQQGTYGFGTAPTLAEVLATVNGLKNGAATNRAIFILRYEKKIPHIMKIPFNRVYGVFVSEKFLLQNNDIVYLAESSWMPYLKVFSLIVQAGVLASIAR